MTNCTKIFGENLRARIRFLAKEEGYDIGNNPVSDSCFQESDWRIVVDENNSITVYAPDDSKAYWNGVFSKTPSGNLKGLPSSWKTGTAAEQALFRAFDSVIYAINNPSQEKATRRKEREEREESGEVTTRSRSSEPKMPQLTPLKDETPEEYGKRCAEAFAKWQLQCEEARLGKTFNQITNLIDALSDEDREEVIKRINEKYGN